MDFSSPSFWGWERFGGGCMTEQEMRLADYRRQVERLTAVVTKCRETAKGQMSNPPKRMAVWDAFSEILDAADSALAKAEPEPKPKPEPEPGPEPKPEERVRIWDKWDLGFVARDGSTIFLRKWAEDFIAARPASAGRYELQPVARRKVIVTVQLDGPCDGLKVGDRVMRWGVVTRVEERDAD